MIHKKEHDIQSLVKLFSEGKFDKCLQESKKASEKYPIEPFIFNLLGVIYATKGYFKEALEKYKLALN